MSERPRRSNTVVISALVAALSLAAAATEVAPLVRQLHKSLTAPSLSATERELAPAVSFDLPTTLMLRAQDAIPRDAVYSVAVGDPPPTESFLPMLVYWLLPRRYTGDLAAAEWIVTYGTSPASIHVRVAKKVPLGDGGTAVEVG